MSNRRDIEGDSNAPQDSEALERYIKLQHLRIEEQKLKLEEEKLKLSTSFIAKYGTLCATIGVAILGPFAVVAAGILNGQITNWMRRPEQAVISAVDSTQTQSTPTPQTQPPSTPPTQSPSPPTPQAQPPPAPPMQLPSAPRVESWTATFDVSRRTVRAASDADFRQRTAREACEQSANATASNRNAVATNIETEIISFRIDRRTGPWYDRWEQQTLQMRVSCKATMQPRS